MTKKYALVSLFAVVVLSLASLSVYAQGSTDELLALCPSLGEASVSVALQPFPSKVISGASLPIVVRVSNLKDYPLSDGMLLVRIIGNELSDKNLAGASGTVFSRSVPVKDILIGSRASKEFSFPLDIPARLPSGKYSVEAVYALSGSDKEDIDADISSGKINTGVSQVNVESPFTDAFVYVDAKSISSATSSDGSISISADIVNLGKAEVSVPLLWKDYYGNAVDEKTALSSDVETVKVPAVGRAKVSHSIKESDRSSYKAVAAVAFNGMWSFATASTKDVQGGAEVHLLGIAPFGIGHQAFACLSNTFVDSKGVTLSVTDGSGMTLGSRTFNLATTTDNMELSLPFDMRGSGDIIITAVTASKSGTKQYFGKTFSCVDLATCPVQQSPEAEQGLPVEGMAAVVVGLGGFIAALILKKRRGVAKAILS